MVTAFAVAIFLPVACYSRPKPIAGGAATAVWTLVRSSHFDVYSQPGEREGRAVAQWLEQLRMFFAKEAMLPMSGTAEAREPVRVVLFRSAQEYGAFQPRPTADAYYAGSKHDDYIVMPSVGPDRFRMTAHEYAHLVLHSLELRLPPWLAEGIAELFSDVRIGDSGCIVGADLPAHDLSLRQMRWIPLPELLNLAEDAPQRSKRTDARVFYAESWALLHMLTFSPAYASRLQEFWIMTRSGELNRDTLARIYAKPLSAIEADLHDWVQQPKPGVLLPGLPARTADFQVSTLTRFESDSMIAGLLLASGEVEKAEAAYTALGKERPDDPAAAAALGAIALRKNNRPAAREYWTRAMELGIRDPLLCYRYAILADDAGLPDDEIIPALRRVLELKPDFDDARYKLALLESNSGNYPAALTEFRAMRSVAPERAYAYWMAVAYALTETNEREQAKEAAGRALTFAATAEERSAASRIAYIADTDLTVQFARDAHGGVQMVTARKPHGSADWNPFIEPTDRIVSVAGRIQKVECNGGRISGFKIAADTQTVHVTLPDPAHVMITGGTPEFVCDAVDQRKVAVQYAASDNHPSENGILRGMQFQ